MTCRACGSTAKKRLESEMALHFPGLAAIERRAVMVFPPVFICVDCGFGEFSVSEPDLSLIKQGGLAAGVQAGS